jgi:predicted transcriptional regulator
MVLKLDVDEATKNRIDEIAEAQGITPADVIRKAVDQFISTQDWSNSWLERAEALGLVGCSDSSPSDLSTNSVHMEGFGRE